MGFDLIFHTFFTTPEETPLYFLAKFGNAFLVSMFTYFIPSVLVGALIGAVAFDLLVAGYYYVAYLLNNPALSCCTIYAPHVNFLPSVTYFTLSYWPITNDVLAFILVHFFVYFVAFLIVAPFAHFKR